MSDKSKQVTNSKPAKRLIHSLTHGNIWLAILSIIKKRKKAYAYSLDNEIEKIYAFKPNKIMIYVVLYKLEDEKLIKSDFIERRKYYALTEKGRRILDFGKNYMVKFSRSL